MLSSCACKKMPWQKSVALASCKTKKMRKALKKQLMLNKLPRMTHKLFPLKKSKNRVKQALNLWWARASFRTKMSFLLPPPHPMN